MQSKRPFKIDSRNASIGGGFVVVLAIAAILAPAAQAGIITPEPAKPAKPTVPQAITPAPAAAPAPSPPSAPPSPSSGTTGQPANGPASNPAGRSAPSNGLPAAPNGPDNWPDRPDLPAIGEGCDIGCMEGWAAYNHAWVLAYGLTPLSNYRPADFALLQGVVADIAAVEEEIATALIAGAHTTLTDPIESFGPSLGCPVGEKASDGDPVLCPS